MQTIVYIDGYNLYYGCLKHSEHKWLDLYRLFSEHIIKSQCPRATITMVKYFTADTLAKMATHGKKSHEAQARYHRALEAKYPDKIEIIKGCYSLDKAVLPKYQRTPNKKDKVEVWRLEEKKTDVNIALHMYRDVIKKRCKQIVLVSNDTDLEPALKAIRDDVEWSIDVGLVIPRKKPSSNKGGRSANAGLSQLADWTRHHILDAELKDSQLPPTIPTKRKPIRRPDYW